MDMQGIINLIAEAENARKVAAHETTMACEAAELKNREDHERALAEIEKAKNESYAATVASIMESIQPGLIEALNDSKDATRFAAAVEHIGPYALAGGESAADAGYQPCLHFCCPLCHGRGAVRPAMGLFDAPGADRTGALVGCQTDQRGGEISRYAFDSR
jgi:hypothetical protein